MHPSRSDVPSAESEPLALSLPDGTHMALQLYRAAAAGNAPVVLWLPAMGVEARYYQPLAAALAAEGCHVLLMELRGLGGSSLRASRRCDFGYEDMAAIDLPAAVAALRECFPGHRLYLGGHSLGAHLASLYLGREPVGAAGFIYIAAGTNYFGVWPFPRSLGVLGFGTFIRVLAGVMGYFPGRAMGFAGNEARSVVRTWYHLMATGRFRVRESPHDYEALMRQVTLPGLVISFSDDRYTPAAAARHLYGKMPRADVTHVVLAPEALDAPDLGHFHWVRAAEPLAARIRSWIDGQAR